MNAAVLLVARFTVFHKNSRLDQRYQQAAGVELYDLCGSGFDTSRHEGIRISQVSNMNRPGWSMIGNYVPGIGCDLEIRFLFQVSYDWTKLLITTGRTEQFYSGSVPERPFVFERVAPGTPQNVVTLDHQICD
jgi:hypothetical protein